MKRFAQVLVALPFFYFAIYQVVTQPDGTTVQVLAGYSPPFPLARQCLGNTIAQSQENPGSVKEGECFDSRTGRLVSPNGVLGNN